MIAPGCKQESETTVVKMKVKRAKIVKRPKNYMTPDKSFNLSSNIHEQGLQFNIPMANEFPSPANSSCASPFDASQYAEVSPKEPAFLNYSNAEGRDHQNPGRVPLAGALFPTSLNQLAGSFNMRGTKVKHSPTTVLSPSRPRSKKRNAINMTLNKGNLSQPKKRLCDSKQIINVLEKSNNAH